MRTSLIITTYNWPAALRRVLESVFAQTVPPDEIVVADDGSGPATAELIGRLRDSSPVPLIHSWQEDIGFRLAMSRNRAIARASGSYILLIDGDILLERHFVEDHCQAARPGFFIQGTRALLGPRLSEEILSRGLQPLSCLKGGIENRKNCLRSPLLSRLCFWTSRSLAGIRTCNIAFWRSDVLAVNGFNEEFIGWGREDSEFVVRMFNSGVRRKNLKFKGIGYHLDHPGNAREGLAANDELLRQCKAQRHKRCRAGIDRYLD